jgi:hypothetical protein
MRIPFCLAALASLALFTGCSSTSSSSSADPAKMQAEMMEKMAKYGTPGDAHKVLQKKVGRWNWTMKHWMTADSPAQEMSGTTETSWTMDGRFVEDKTRSTFEGMPFEGRGYAGYDNITEKYTFFWFDNMSTGFMTGEGTWDPSTKTFTWHTKGSNPMTGEECKGWSKETFIDNDHWTAEFHGPDMNGKEYKSMEMTMTRAR